MNTRWLGAGLFFAALATLLIETLDAPLLSVVTWYHLSFLAVSVAMLGVAAGAVYVFLHPARFTREHSPTELSRAAMWFTVSIPTSHLLTLVVPFVPITDGNAMELLSIASFTIILAVPFALSGVVITVALTRLGGPIGRLYAFDLVGAALGCLLVIALLDRLNISSAFLIAGAASAAAAYCFRRGAGLPGANRAAIIGVVLIAVALFNSGSSEIFHINYPKNRQLWLQTKLNTVARWNSHSYVIAQRPREEPAFLWGRGRGAEQFRTNIAWLAIDGEAGTPITEWNGGVGSLEWVSYDVTTLPYYLRQGGDVAVIGFGGGRDLLAALWGRSRSVVGVDVNRIMVDLLSGSHRSFAGIADRPEVKLVHDDGRAYLTRATARFDVIQMSLVDTWASTGAGAFSLSENGLYTLDAWRVFLARLKPGGILSVSRWFDPTNVSETSRLLALGMAALLDRGVPRPVDHIMLIVCGGVATLMVSPSPFTEADKARVRTTAQDREFVVAVAAGLSTTTPGLLDRIARSTSMLELDHATADALIDYRPPTDARPYFFNMLKPRALWDRTGLPRGGVLAGNLRATYMLLILLGITTVLVASVIIGPLITAGRPAMDRTRFVMTLAYFAIIGFAFMLVQIALLQRFSIYMGHPTYTLSIVLFSMLLFAGIGSLVSERLSVVQGSRLFGFVPAAIAAALVVVSLSLPSVIARTITASLLARSAVVLAFASPLAMLLGMCFPFGVRVTRDTPEVVPWVWGINGACGVLSSVIAVAISIWIGIEVNFWLAAALYLVLTFPLMMLARSAKRHV